MDYLQRSIGNRSTAEAVGWQSKGDELEQSGEIEEIVVEAGPKHDTNVKDDPPPTVEDRVERGRRRPLRVEADLDFVTRTRPVFDGSGVDSSGIDRSPVAKHDKVVGNVALGSQVVKSGSVGAGNFGEEWVKYKLRNFSWKAAKGVVSVKATVYLDITWNVNARGRTDVSNAASPAVTAGTWKQAAKDLTPSASGRPPRTSYWSRALTTRHEKFHASDDIGRATLYLPTATTWLNSRKVAVSKLWPVTNARVHSLAKKLVGKVKADGWAWYRAGGEARAYADGKASYAALAAAIRTRATANKWK